MSSVGGAAWKTEEEVAAHMKTEEHMENKCKTIRKTGFAEQKQKDIRTDAWKKTDR